ncbi:MAG: peptidoglycan DD-metalloendopeptidase family protein [Kangiellaceae bacterium]|nr:peptidoglycan DD-metalloendopeptidase family protein [Kangiellaceae bacterium]
MINRDYKGLGPKKPLFSRKKQRRKGILVTTALVAGTVATASYLYPWGSPSASSDNMAPGEESLVLETTTQSLPLNLSLSTTESATIKGSHETELSQQNGQLSLTIAPQQAQNTNASTSALEVPTSAPNEQTATAQEIANTLNTVESAIEQSVEWLQPSEPQIDWRKVTVSNGDSLAKIFKNQGFSSKDLHYIMKSGDQIKKLQKIRPGHELEFAANDDDSFQALRYPYSLSETLVVTKTNDKQFDVSIDKKAVEYKQRFATATISSSFYNAGKEANLPDGVIMELAGVFEYDIDFALEIRKGDNFSVLYQEKYIDGKKVGYGDILSAEFTNQGDHYAAVQYTDSNNRTAYYSPEGKALRKSFLRAPLKFNYVSSNFNPKRFHPIQKRVKPHRGVDYRAPTGTPVRAAGDGRVVKSAYNKYNGHYVFIQHGNNVVTKYLHFSKRAVKSGERVKQGQIVGYVGSTGMSQAPHLHYEFVVGGVHRNPRTVKLPHAAPVPKTELARFKEQTKPLLEKLQTERTTYFARANSESSATSTDATKLQK